MYKMSNFCCCLCVGIILLFSCSDNDDEIKADIPDLTVEYITMSGSVGLFDALTFKIGDAVYKGFGWNVGMIESKRFYAYSPNTREWTEPIAEFPGEFRYDPVTFTIGSKVYVGLGYGGRNSTGFHLMDDFYVYDKNTNEWEALSYKFPGKARRGAVAFAIGGKGYVGSGHTTGDDYLADFYEFDPKMGWKEIQRINTPRAGAHAFVADGCGYVCFGNLYGNPTPNQNIQKYDPVTGQWKGLQVQYESGEKHEILGLDRVMSFTLNKDNKEYIYFTGVDRTENRVDGAREHDTNVAQSDDAMLFWGYNPRENIWKKVTCRNVGERGVALPYYMFSVGEQGYIMGVGEEGGNTGAYIFRFAE